MSYIYFYLILITLAANIAIFIIAFFHRKINAVKAFMIFDSFIIIALIFYGASLVVNDFDLKVKMHELKFIGITYFFVAFYYTFCTYFEKTKLITKTKLLLISIVPTTILIAALTNPYHHFFRKSFYPIINEYGYFVGVESGPLFMVFVAYTYMIYIVSLAVALQSFFKTPKMFRTQTTIIIVTATVVFIVSFVAASGLVFYDFGDATLVTFSVGSLLLFYGFIFHKPANLIKIARYSAMNEISSPIMIFDYKNEFFDCNVSAHNLFGKKKGVSLENFLDEIGYSGEDFTFCKDDFIYSLSIKEIIDDGGTFSGNAIVLNNISDIKKRETFLEDLAFKDYMTDIPNRQALIDYLSKIKNDVMPVAVVHINIAGMKNINHVLGIKVGDEVVKKVAREVSKIENSFCARLNGDEFAIILIGATEQVAQHAVAQIRENIGEIEIHSGIAVKQTLFDNIQIVFRESADDLYRNKIIYNARN